MPDPVTHYVFSMQVISELPDRVRNNILPPVFERALQGPDPWSTLSFYGGNLKRYSYRSSIMHKNQTGPFLTALSRQAKANPHTPVFSVLAGVICHYCLDKTTHPYINCKAGSYDGTEETKWQCGGHVRLERAIDSYYIRHTFQQTPWHFSIPGNILRLKRYPESLREPLNKVYRDIYGWEKPFDQINASFRDERWFYGLMQDPFGIVQLLLQPVSGGNTNFRVYSYFHREIAEGEVDFLNLRHEPWQHPQDPTLVSTESFFDLFAKAKKDAVDMISRIYGWIFEEASLDTDGVFGNYSYSTGFDCEDPRNFTAPICQPLRLGQ